MTEPSTDLVAETRELLKPGDIDLVGAIIESEYTDDQELEMMEVTVEIGEIIAENQVDEPTYVYSGNDDDRFSSNQHQGLTISGDDFVWECQQLLIDGTFDIVFYFEASEQFEELIDEIRTAGYHVTGVQP